MPRRFPLFSLPNRALHHRVFRHFTWDILFELSQCSSKSKKIVQEWTRSLSKKRKRELVVHLMDSSSEVILSNHDGTFSTWEIASTRSIEFRKWEELLTPRTLNGMEMSVGRVTKAPRSLEKLIGCVGDPPYIVLMTVIDYLIEVLNCNFGNILIDTDCIDDVDALLNWESFRRPDYFSWSCGSLEPHHIAKIFDATRGKTELRLTVNCEPFEFTNTVSTRNFIAESLTWFTSSNLFNIDSERIMFNEQNFDQQVYKDLIEHWMRGGFPKLVAFRNTCWQLCDDPLWQLDMDTILEGIPSYPGVPKRYDPVDKYSDSGAHYANGRDIFREDGKMATLLIRSHQHYNQYFEVAFVVWNRKHPDERNEYLYFYNLFNV